MACSPPQHADVKAASTTKSSSSYPSQSTASCPPSSRRSSLPTMTQLLAGLDMFLHLCAPPGKYRIIRILGFYYITARIFTTFIVALLFAQPRLASIARLFFLSLYHSSVQLDSLCPPSSLDWRQLCWEEAAFPKIA
ncbi:hypothetical protein Naga_100651g3 [Nannochloropsis gaditana]|uniref:Uncharacterized protein n=1 Tax=Nannochloropsis gaditana TaxID=72520 RepID=W7T8Z0_9STRA|nr:hypothetical protein Naga_100651g3 [Nannochloropsis gaditana]